MNIIRRVGFKVDWISVGILVGLTVEIIDFNPNNDEKLQQYCVSHRFGDHRSS